VYRAGVHYLLNIDFLLSFPRECRKKVLKRINRITQVDEQLLHSFTCLLFKGRATFKRFYLGREGKDLFAFCVYFCFMAALCTIS